MSAVASTDTQVQVIKPMSTGDLGITRFTIEHFPGDALGIPTATPRMNWTYSRPVPDGSQIHVNITRRVPGGRSRTQETYLPADSNVLVPWQFEPLMSREEVFATVQIVSAAHHPLSAVSEVLHFEAGLFEEFDHIADFVGPSWPECETDHRRLPLVRTEVELDGKPVRARLYLSALGLVEAEVNGRKVGNDALIPGWTDYNNRVECWTYDVTETLEAGANALGFWLGDGWYRGRLGFDGGYANFYGDRIGVFAQLEVEYADGHETRVCSNAWDRKWKVAPGPIICSDMCEGERYDAREEMEGWSMPGFDDSDWKPVAEVPYDPARIENPVTSPVRGHELHAPKSITKYGVNDDGKTVWLVDFGQNCSQRIRLHMRGLRSGERVTLHHAEVLEPDGSLATRTLRRGQQCDVYVSNGVDAWWEPRFAMHGFRYATIEGLPDELTADDMECRVYHSVMERAGEFFCSNELLNKLHSNVVWSMRSNFVSIPTDCPQRDERLGWTGDICLFAPTAAYLYDTQGFLGSWLRDVRNEQIKWGTVPFYVPFVPLGGWAHPKAISTWGDSAVNVPWVLYMDSGDPQVLADSYDLVCGWIDEVSGYLSEDGVWDRRPDYILGQLGDWLDPTAPPDDPTQAMTEKELVATAFFARSCAQAARVAQILGHADDAERFAALRDHVTAGYIARFTNLDGTMTSDTQCAYALSIAFGLLDGEPVRRIKAGNRLAELVRESGGKVSTGFAGTPFVLPALSATGHDQEAYDLLLSTQCPSWLYQVKMGATTMWERWDSMREDGSLNPGGMTSFNHYALGSVAEWLHSHVGGLEAIEPGWKRFRVSPRVYAALDHAGTSHITPYGKAAVSWMTAAGKLDLEVTVPVGASAVVDLPDHEPVELGAGTHHLTMAL